MAICKQLLAQIENLGYYGSFVVIIVKIKNTKHCEKFSNQKDETWKAPAIA